MKFKKHLILYVIIILKISLIIFLFFPQINCTVTGGEWEQVRWDRIEDFNRYYTCVYKFPDGGKPCNSSSDCRGRCIINKFGNNYCEYKTY